MVASVAIGLLMLLDLEALVPLLTGLSLILPFGTAHEIRLVAAPL
jgi:hypothetical protein